MGKKHARLSPSAAHRWLHCTAAPRREEAYPDASSDFAKEGTLAHAYAARALKIYNGDKGTPEELKEIDDLREFYSPDMDGYVEQYAGRVIEALNEARSVDEEARLLVESRVALPGRDGAACHGTADAIIVNDWQLEVFDFKYGKGVRVKAEENPQMMIYALGAVALMERKGIPVPESIRMTIVQPRINHLDSYETTLAALTDWMRDTLAPRIREASGDYGRASAGDWCRFCRCRGECRELAAYCLGGEFPVPGQVDAGELAGRILPRLGAVKAWVREMEERALALALGGTALPGWKVVEGRSVRRFSDAGAVAERLAAEGVEDIYRPRELKTLTELERSLGRKRFREVLGEYVTKAPGKPALVEDGDPRPHYKGADEFAGIVVDD